MLAASGHWLPDCPGPNGILRAYAKGAQEQLSAMFPQQGTFLTGVIQGSKVRDWMRDR